MSFKDRDAQPDLSLLLVTLQQSRELFKNNPALYQTLSQLIQRVNSIKDDLNAQILALTTSVTNIVTTLTETFLTASDETATLVNSRQLLAGTNVTFDDTVAGQRTINVAASSGVDHVVMSDGATPTPAPVDDGFGNFIYIPYTP